MKSPVDRVTEYTEGEPFRVSEHQDTVVGMVVLVEYMTSFTLNGFRGLTRPSVWCNRGELSNSKETR